MTRSIDIGVTYLDADGNRLHLANGMSEVRITVGDTVFRVDSAEEARVLARDLESVLETAFPESNRKR